MQIWVDSIIKVILLCALETVNLKDALKDFVVNPLNKRKSAASDYSS